MLSHQQLRAEGYTHKGWFGVCPVYLGGHEQQYCVKVAPRWWYVVPLFWVSFAAQAVAIYFCSWFNPEYVPCWAFRVTGELDGQ